jgi:hypothetical protein
MRRDRHNRSFARRAAVISAVLLGAGMAAAAHAGTVSWSGTDDGNTVGGTTTTIGALMTPSNLVLSDTFATNTTGSPIVNTDDWTFTIPTTQIGVTTTGEQLSLQNFAVTGLVDSIALYSGTPTGSNALIASGTPTGSFSSFLLTDLTSSGSYYLQITSTLAPGNFGSYTGTIVAAAVPLPATLPLLVSGLAAGGLLLRRRKGS